MRIKVLNPAEKPLVEAAARRVLSICLREPSGWPESDFPGFRTLNRGGRAGVAVIEISGRLFCVKLFYDSRRLVEWRNRIGLSKAGRAFRKGVGLAHRGVNCPAMIGYAEDPKSGKALLITEWAQAAQRMDRWIEINGPVADAAQALGRFLRRMHDVGVSHQDLSLRNLLIQPVQGGYEFLLLDYEDTRFSSGVVRGKRLQDLHHLNERALRLVPENIRREFLAAYLGDNGDIEEWCRALQRMLAENPSKYTLECGKESAADV
jgi:tRNA A-37 threonylcarbamoyl transferase component Bud32